MLRRIALALSLGFLLAACQPEAEVKVGAPAPDITLIDLEGNESKLSDYKGDVLFVNFWWAGCGPCLREMPELDDVYAQYRDKGFHVLGINMGQKLEQIRNANRRIDVSFPLFMDELKITSQQYKVEFPPTSFIINRDGIITEQIIGPVSDEELEEKIKVLL